jgi:hypothetical protein
MPSGALSEAIMDIQMAFIAIAACVATFLLLFCVLASVGLALVHALMVGARWLLRSQPACGGCNPDPAWRVVIFLLAFPAAAVLTGVGWFGHSTDVYCNPSSKKNSIQFQQLSAWRSIVGPTSSDCFIDIDVVHVSAEGKRTSVRIIEESPAYRENPELAPGRRIVWAKNNSGREVVTTDAGEKLFLPDFLLTPYKVSSEAIESYLQGYRTTNDYGAMLYRTLPFETWTYDAGRNEWSLLQRLVTGGPPQMACKAACAAVAFAVCDGSAPRSRIK